MANYITPNLEAEIAPYGILSPASNVVELDHGAWESRFEYTDYTCVSELTYEGICIPGVTEPVEVNSNTSSSPMREYYPFVISTEFQCSTFGMTPEEVYELGSTNLELITQKAVEMEFDEGHLSSQIDDSNIDNPINSYLQDGTAIDITPVVGTGVSARAGLALLEDKLGRDGVGARGTIHATRSAASRVRKKYDKFDKTEDCKGPMLSENGNYIISGVGYSGHGPNGEEPSAGSVWMYATGRTHVFLSPIEVIPNEGQRTIHQAVDIRTNTIEYIASRTAAVIHSGCAKYAVLVDITK